MPGDKINRVKSIKKWLEKAEHSYSSHKDLTGELNLIMARAEMQRLNETTQWKSMKSWILRGSALAVACLLFAGGIWGWKNTQILADPSHDSVAVSEKMTSMNQAQPKDSILSKEQNISQAVNVIPEGRGSEVHAIEVNPSTTVEEDNTNYSSVETPQITEGRAAADETVSTESPVLSTREVQSVVGEAGRALRGQ